MTPESQSAPERFGSRRSSVMLKCGSRQSSASLKNAESMFDYSVKVKWQMAPFRRCASDLRAHGFMLRLPSSSFL